MGSSWDCGTSSVSPATAVIETNVPIRPFISHIVCHTFTQLICICLLPFLLSLPLYTCPPVFPPFSLSPSPLHVCALQLFKGWGEGVLKNAEHGKCLNREVCFHGVLIAYFNSQVSLKTWVNTLEEKCALYFHTSSITPCWKSSLNHMICWP